MKIKIAIVEDSPTACRMLKQILRKDSLLEIVGIFESAEEAVTAIAKCSPDVWLVDIHLPGMNGYDLTRKIMIRDPRPVLIITAETSGKEAELSFKSMEVGALSVLEKPKGLLDPKFQEQSDEIIQQVKMAAGVSFSIESKKSTLNKKIPAKAVAIGGSLGGPLALKEIFSNLPQDFSVPIFVVQHIAAGFSKELIKWLQGYTSLKIKLGSHFEKPEGGCIYFAPDNYNMIISKNHIIRLYRDSRRRPQQPSVSQLFQSMADSYGKSGVGVILTGMGRDGANELLLMSKNGAVTIAQNDESSVMFGMPKEAINLGGVKYVLPLVEIAPMLVKLTN